MKVGRSHVDSLKLEEIDDDLIVSMLLTPTGKTNHHLLAYCENMRNSIYEYLISRYDDSLSLKETIQRIANKIDAHPKCPICGKPVLYMGKKKRFWLQTCSEECGFKLRTQHIVETCREKYDCGNPFQVEEFKGKIRATNLERRGVESSMQDLEVRRKSEETCMQKYGVKNAGGTKESIEKGIETQKERYGDLYVRTQEYADRMDAHMIEKFGVKHYLQLPEGLAKQQETLRRTQKYNRSKFEEQVFEILKTLFNEEDIMRQYSSDEYPFMCDFYVKSLNLYIEAQGYYTHGKHPYNPNSIEDQKELEELRKRDASSKQKHSLYANKIRIWTEVDPKKRKTAETNGIELIEVFNKTDIKEKLIDRFKDM